MLRDGRLVLARARGLWPPLHRWHLPCQQVTLRSPVWRCSTRVAVRVVRKPDVSRYRQTHWSLSHSVAVALCRFPSPRGPHRKISWLLHPTNAPYNAHSQWRYACATEYVRASQIMQAMCHSKFAVSYAWASEQIRQCTSPERAPRAWATRTTQDHA